MSAIGAGPKVIGGGRLAAALPPRRPHSLVRGATFLRRQLPTSRFCRLCRAQVLHPPHSAESQWSFSCFSKSQVPAALRKSAAKRSGRKSAIFRVYRRVTPCNAASDLNLRSRYTVLSLPTPPEVPFAQNVSMMCDVYRTCSVLCSVTEVVHHMNTTQNTIRHTSSTHFGRKVPVVALLNRVCSVHAARALVGAAQRRARRVPRSGASAGGCRAAARALGVAQRCWEEATAGVPRTACFSAIGVY